MKMYIRLNDYSSCMQCLFRGGGGARANWSTFYGPFNQPGKRRWERGCHSTLVNSASGPHQSGSVSAIEVSLVLFGNTMWSRGGPISLNLLSAELAVFWRNQDGISRSNGRVFVEVVERSDKEVGGICSSGSIGQVFCVWNVHGSYCHPGYKILFHYGVVIHKILAKINLR